MKGGLSQEVGSIVSCYCGPLFTTLSYDHHRQKMAECLIFPEIQVVSMWYQLES